MRGADEACRTAIRNNPATNLRELESEMQPDLQVKNIQTKKLYRLN